MICLFHTVAEVITRSKLFLAYSGYKDTEPRIIFQEDMKIPYTMRTVTVICNHCSSIKIRKHFWLTINGWCTYWHLWYLEWMIPRQGHWLSYAIKCCMPGINNLRYWFIICNKASTFTHWAINNYCQFQFLFNSHLLTTESRNTD